MQQHNHDYIQANTDGKLHDATEPSVSPLNRGFLYGDAIYEVWRTYEGTVFAFDEHWRRLERSAKALYLAHGLDPARLLYQMKRTAAAFRARTGHGGELYLRLQITRGAGPIGLDTALADAPSWVLLVQRLAHRGPRGGQLGLELTVATGLRRNPVDALDPAWKTGNYLNNLLCLREARARGADEVVMCNQRGLVAEAAVSNIFFVQQGVLVTPPTSVGILAGVTRELILSEVASRAGLTVREQEIRPADFGGFEECFLTSTTRDVTPVAAIDEHPFHVGAESVTEVLKAAFQEYALGYSAGHPELAL
jgi:branched-chain amino acid aminotransferase